MSFFVYRPPSPARRRVLWIGTSGNVLVSGTATGTSATSASATGRAIVQGSASGTSATSGTATGIVTHHQYSGTASATSPTSASAAGAVRVHQSLLLGVGV